jgi:hypothetical protein
MKAKLFLGMAVALAALITLAYLERAAPPTLAGSFAVTVEGPDGTQWINATVAVEDGTPYAVLAQAGHEHGYPVEKNGDPGRCDVYVVRIGQVAASDGPAGWVYEVRHADGTRLHPAMAADCYELSPGDSVRWHWTETGVAET